jgi:hypothetical protein
MAAKPGLPGAAAPKVSLTPELIATIKENLVERGLPPKLYKFSLADEEVIFRPLVLADYATVQDYIQANEGRVRQDDIDYKIIEKGLVWPQELVHHENWERQPAGLQSTLAKQILARSGFFVDEVDQSEFMRVEILTQAEHGPKPEPAVVEALKAKYPWSLRLVQLDGEYFVVRPVARAEWRQITGADAADMDLVTAERACVWSRDYPEAPKFGERVAGVCRSLAEVVMAISGFSSNAQVEEL